MYQPEDLLLLSYTSMRVGRRINADEATALNDSRIPWDGVHSVERPTHAVHYVECGAKGAVGIARTIRDTTCIRCLLFRARQLRGLRWSIKSNREEVEYLTLQLGDRVKGFDAPQPGDVALASMIANPQA